MKARRGLSLLEVILALAILGVACIVHGAGHAVGNEQCHGCTASSSSRAGRGVGTEPGCSGHHTDATQRCLDTGRCVCVHFQLVGT